MMKMLEAADSLKPDKGSSDSFEIVSTDKSVLDKEKSADLSLKDLAHPCTFLQEPPLHHAQSTSHKSVKNRQECHYKHNVPSEISLPLLCIDPNGESKSCHKKKDVTSNSISHSCGEFPLLYVPPTVEEVPNMQALLPSQSSTIQAQGNRNFPLLHCQPLNNQVSFIANFPSDGTMQLPSVIPSVPLIPAVSHLAPPLSLYTPSHDQLPQSLAKAQSLQLIHLCKQPVKPFTLLQIEGLNHIMFQTDIGFLQPSHCMDLKVEGNSSIKETRM